MSVNDLLENISGLCMYGFFDSSRNMVIVHFFNDDSSKPDIVAYLLKDMSWDVRKIVDEVATLGQHSETIEIKHEVVGVFEIGSVLDKIIREGLSSVVDALDENTLINSGKMLEILKNNSY